jgi:hypothetical protein
LGDYAKSVYLNLEVWIKIHFTYIQKKVNLDSIIEMKKYINYY